MKLKSIQIHRINNQVHVALILVIALDLNNYFKQITLMRFFVLIQIISTTILILKIENKLFFGSPYTPTFGNWYFMKSKEIIHKYWEQMEEGIDVLITHGPPYGILDLVDNFEFKQAGCTSLLNHVYRIKPKFHIFGHIHDNNDCLNHGIMIREDITFINASLVKDGKRFLQHKPIIIEI
jgi:Icc-related predicted phosphoesterase